MQVFPPLPRRQTRSLLDFAGSLWKKPTQRTVLVIGGAGYIGSALLPKLLDRGHRVRVLDRLFYGTEPIQSMLDHPNLEIAQADFRQIEKIVECMRGVDAVIHLGAIVGDPACALDRDLTIEVNLMATRTIAEVAKGSGVRRFIFASTCSVYGASDEDQLLDETSPLNPVSLYAVSKLASEKVLMDMASESFSPTCLRFSTIYGLSGRTRFDLVVNLLTAKAVMDGQITIQGGDQWRPFLHVDDAALSVLHTLEAPLGKVHQEVFNVGSNEQNYTIQQAGELIQRIVPDAKLINMGSGGDRRDYKASFNKIRDTLGFMPQWTVEDGIRQVIDVIKRGEVTDYREAKYSNVKYLVEEEDTAQLVRHESSWANDLIAQISLTCQSTVAERQAVIRRSIAVAA
jgi:nucleoside-diphosphate-sugar epimerase